MALQWSWVFLLDLVKIENQAGFSKEQEAQVQQIQKLSNLDDTVRGGIKDLLDITWSGEEDKQTATA